MFRRDLSLLMSVLALTSAASANTIIYTDAASFEAAAGTLNPITFSTVSQQFEGLTYAWDGITFDATGGCADDYGGCTPGLYLESATSGATGGYAQGALFSYSYQPAILNLTLDAPVYEIGIYFGEDAGYNGAGSTITLSDGTVYNLTVAPDLFFGAISDTLLTSLDIYSPHGFGLAVAEVTLGTPEPTPAEMMPAGMLMMTLLVYGRSRKRAFPVPC